MTVPVKWRSDSKPTKNTAAWREINTATTYHFHTSNPSYYLLPFATFVTTSLYPCHVWIADWIFHVISIKMTLYRAFPAPSGTQHVHALDSKRIGFHYKLRWSGTVGSMQKTLWNTLENVIQHHIVAVLINPSLIFLSSLISLSLS